MDAAPARCWPAESLSFSALLVGLAIQTQSTICANQVGLVGSLLLGLASVAISGGAWPGISLLLPLADADWRALVAGAALFAAGMADPAARHGLLPRPEADPHLKRTREALPVDRSFDGVASKPAIQLLMRARGYPTPTR